MNANTRFWIVLVLTVLNACTVAFVWQLTNETRKLCSARSPWDESHAQTGTIPEIPPGGHAIIEIFPAGGGGRP